MTSSTEEPKAVESVSQDGDEKLVRMSLGDHLEELRRRIAWSLLAIVGGVVLVLPFKDSVTGIYTRPYEQMWFQHFDDAVSKAKERIRLADENGEEIYSSVREQMEWLLEKEEDIRSGALPPEGYELIKTRGGVKLPRTLTAFSGIEDIWTFMGATLLFGLLLGAPIVLYQAWAFLAAGLYPHEKKVVLRVFPFAVLLLIAGASFGFFVAVPTGLYFLVKLMNFGYVQPVIGVSNYFGFLLMLTGALGAVFQLPVLMVALDKVGIMGHHAMRKNWRWVILLAFVFSAMLTPPDPFTQLMMAGPVIVLYVIGLLVTRPGAKRAEV
ncbi:MAG: twin-arginine translocase subunit TatC [Planctomycetota bacterium]